MKHYTSIEGELRSIESRLTALRRENKDVTVDAYLSGCLNEITRALYALKLPVEH
jgi:hypothetical protein